jgi:DNA-binding MarR family transcriptional regulator
MAVDLNQWICFNFYNGWRQITSFYKDTLGMDVTPQKVYVLELLELDKKITMNELSEGMNLDSSAVSTLVSRMEKNGLLKRTHGTKDRRTVFVQLTKQGSELRNNLRSKFGSLTDKIGKNISDDEIATLQRIVSKLIVNQKSAHEPG